MAGPFNISNLFRNTQQVSLPQQQAPQGQPQQPQQPQGPTGRPGSSMEPPQNQQQPNQQQQPGQQTQQPNSPLDAFADLWKNDPTKTVDPNADPFSAPLFQADPTKIREAASQMNFTQQIPQELMQRVMAGNDPQAIVEMVNAVAQQAMATSIQLSTATTEQAGQRIGQRFNAALPGRFKDFQLQSTEPGIAALSHPAAGPILEAVRQRIKMQNPDMPVGQIQKMAEQYLTQFSSSMLNVDPNNPQQPAGGAKEQEFNWLNWANSAPGQGQ